MFLAVGSGLRAMVMLGLYVLGFMAALVTAKLLNSSVMKASDALHSGACRSTAGRRFASLALRLYDRGKLFLKKAGTVILACTFLVWVLSVLPIHGGQFSEFDRRASSAIWAIGSSRCFGRWASTGRSASGC